MNEDFKEFIFFTSVIFGAIFGFIGVVAIVIAAWAFTGPWLGLPVTVLVVSAVIGALITFG